jgi:hypothetical protein
MRSLGVDGHRSVRISFASIDIGHRCQMHDDIDTARRSFESIRIADI